MWDLQLKTINSKTITYDGLCGTCHLASVGETT